MAADSQINNYFKSLKQSQQKEYSSDANQAVVMANGRFMITKSIGKGSFGEIFQGLDT